MFGFCKRNEEVVRSIPHPIKKDTIADNWDTVFMKVEIRALNYMSTTNWIEYKQIKYSGRKVEVENCRVLYECFDENKIIWVDEGHLNFPK